MYAQPNLTPPITTTDRALEYKNELQVIDPDVEYMMTLYLTRDLTPEEIRKAHNAGIAGQHLDYSSLPHSLAQASTKASSPIPKE